MTRILIVEDETIVAENLAVKLRQLGYEVIGIAAEGEAALDMVKHLNPQLILMDIKLGGDLDGIEAADAIRRQFDVPVIFLTAHSDPVTLSRAKLTGPSGYILKPFEIREVATQIELGLYKHQAERELREQREWLKVTLASIGDGVIATDETGCINYINPVAEGLTGWSSDAAVGKPLPEVFNIVNEQSRQVVEDPVRKVLRTGTIVGLANHTILIRRDGSEVAIDDSGAPIRDRMGGIQGVVLVFRDIGERRRAEMALFESEQRFRALFENSPSGILLIQSNDIILSVNPSACRIFGASAQGLCGVNYHSLLDSESPGFQGAMGALKQKGEVRGRELTAIRKNGERFPIEMDIGVLRTDQSHAFILIRDIGERKRLEGEREKLRDQLNQAQKMESVGRLAGGVAHDFNNMLGIILGHAELAMDQVDPASPLQGDLEEIQAAAQRSANLTRQLLAFARKQVISPKVLDLNDAITDMIKMLRHLIGEEIDLAWIHGANLWPVRIDPAQIDQLLANLCVNARDAIGGVGKITIETRNIAIDQAYCGTHPDCRPGKYVMLAVIDDGCGMEPEVQKNLFEPFFTTKGVGVGTGLGLSTVYGIVKQNGGFITFYSEPEKGAVFRVHLPAAMETPDMKQAAETPEPKVRGNETLLIVEDERSILRLAKSILERLGYKVLAAQSPIKALAMVEDYRGPIDLVITDVVMPEMNGRQLKEKIMERLPDVKVLFMSGYTADVVANRGIIEKDVLILEKPFTNSELAQKVRTILDEP
jgi:two-component system, cell cycle sensor histidine kinase and response regulator CckA